MQKYVIYAKDFTDEGALDRRMAIRVSHFDGIKVLKANGNLIEGGAMVNEGDKMMGSVMLVQFAGKADLEAYLAGEPYILNKVWDSVEIHKFGVPPPL